MIELQLHNIYKTHSLGSDVRCCSTDFITFEMLVITDRVITKLHSFLVRTPKLEKSIIRRSILQSEMHLV